MFAVSSVGVGEVWQLGMMQSLCTGLAMLGRAGRAGFSGFGLRRLGLAG